MMKFKVFILTLWVSVNSLADIDLHFNNQGDFIPPDVYLQTRGLEQYQQGFTNAAIGSLKNSAEFGNELSKYIISMLYFEKKDWITGYAWLLLVDEPIEDRDKLLHKFKTQLTTEEINAAKIKWHQLKQDYNDLASLKRRDKWERSLVATGTRIRGIRAYANKNLVFGGLNVPVQPMKLTREVLKYVQEIEPESSVIMGEIKEKDDGE